MVVCEAPPVAPLSDWPAIGGLLGHVADTFPDLLVSQEIPGAGVQYVPARSRVTLPPREAAGPAPVSAVVLPRAVATATVTVAEVSIPAPPPPLVPASPIRPATERVPTVTPPLRVEIVVAAAPVRRPLLLQHLCASAEAHTIRTEWATARETDQLGYNLYRVAAPRAWEAVKAQAVRVNRRLVHASLSGEGEYAVVDHDVAPGATYYYWLAEVGVNFETRMHGPVEGRARRVDEVHAVCTVPADADEGCCLFRVEAAQLRGAGVPEDALAADAVKAWVDGQEVPTFVSALGEFLQADDFVLVYCERAADAPLQVQVGAGPEPLRMDVAPAAPDAEAAYEWVGRSQDGNCLAFEVDGSRKRSIVSGFQATQAWILDVSDARRPGVLYGFASHTAADETAYTLTHAPGGGGLCLVIGTNAVIRLDVPGGSE